MITQDQKDCINKVILECLGYSNINKDRIPNELKDVEKYFNISEKDYSEILKRKSFAEDQLKNDFEFLSTLIALRRYSSDLEQEVVETNSTLMMDNYDEELESYVRSYL